MHLHPAVLPVTLLAALGLLVFRPKLARASTVSSANRNLKNLLPPSPSVTPESTTANSSDYVDHLADAARDTAIVHSDLTYQAQAGHVDPQTATHTMLQAAANLSAPIDTLTMQRDLNVLGLDPPLKEDGVMGTNTKKALADFQTKMLLPSTGVPDPATFSALRRAVTAVLQARTGSDTATSGFWSSFADAIGISSDVMDTKTVQHMLNVLGSSPRLAEDGRKGPMTTQAIKDFQAHNGLKVDGIVGPETASALNYFVAAVSPQLQAYVDLPPSANQTAGYGYPFTPGYGPQVAGQFQVAGYGSYPMAGYTSSGGW